MAEEMKRDQEVQAIPFGDRPVTGSREEAEASLLLGF